jgi:hypothetical protein
MTKSLYDEAIADAKQLRQLAEQNAKNAIVEAVTPKIREFIEDQLLQNENQDSDSEGSTDVLSEVASQMFESNDQDVIIDETALSSLINLLGDGESIDASSPAVKDALRESASSLNQFERNKLVSTANKIKENVKKMSSNAISISDNSREKPTMSNRRKEETLYEVDLASLSRLVEAAHSDMEEMHHGHMEEDMHGDMDEDMHGDMDEDMYMEDMDMDEEMYYERDEKAMEKALREAALVLDLGDELTREDLEPLEALLGSAQLTIDYGEEGEADDGDEDLDVMMGDEEALEPLPDEGDLEPLDEVFEIDPRMLKTEISRLREKLAEAASGLHDAKGGADAMESQFGGAGSAAAGLKNVYGGKSGKKGDSFGGGKREGDAFESPPSINKLAEVRRLQRNLKNETRRNRDLQGKLNKYRSAVETLRGQLTEMNLFNAKLLYVNKLLQNKSVSNSQKKSIIESIDNARTLREVKILYKGLMGTTQKTKSKTLSESRVRRTLGSSSKATRPGSTQNGVAEVNRWAKLAGLK